VTMRSRYHDARAVGLPAIEAVRYAVHRRLSLCIKWHWTTGMEASIK